MKEFAVYTLARIGLFVASYLVVTGLFLAFGRTSVLLQLLLAAVVSAVASYYLLQGPRQRFAARVDARAANIARRFEETRAKEDQD